MDQHAVPQTPANYIAHDRGVLTGHQFGMMLDRHFSTLGARAGDIFLQFHEAAQRQPDLRSAFYASVKRSFLGLKPGMPSASRRWDDVMKAIISVAAQDETLATYVRRDLVGQALPALIGTKQSSSVDYQAASDILTELGSRGFADCVDPVMAHRIVKWHLGQYHNNYAHAADTLSALRRSPPFAQAINEVEDRVGIHVRSARAENETHGGGSLVLRFDRAHHHVEALVVHRHHNRIGMDQLALDDETNPHLEQVGDMLLLESEQSPHAWVEPIATAAYCRLEV